MKVAKLGKLKKNSKRKHAPYLVARRKLLHQLKADYSKSGFVKVPDFPWESYSQ